MKRLFVFIAFCFAFVLAGFAQEQAFTSMNSDEFAKLLTKKKVQVVDVRTSNEFESGHLQGAVNMDVLKKEFNAQILQLKKKSPVAVYCKTGKRSKVAAKKLASLGYKVYELDPGIVGWRGEVVK